MKKFILVFAVATALFTLNACSPESLDDNSNEGIEQTDPANNTNTNSSDRPRPDNSER